MEKLIKVFIADSSREFTELLRQRLDAEEDFVVVGTATRGDTAYRDIPTRSPDLLVTDLLLPELDGVSLLRRLKADGRLPHTIVVSGFYNDRVARIVSAIADNYLPKPCRTDDLICHMRESVNGHGRSFAHSCDRLVSAALTDCGIMAHLNGYRYLQNALIRALEDRSVLHGVTKSLYRDIAKDFGTTAACVERSIRSAIEHAWRQKSSAERHVGFGRLFDAFDQPPSNVPFLTVMTEYLEGLFTQSEVRR